MPNCEILDTTERVPALRKAFTPSLRFSLRAGVTLRVAALSSSRETARQRPSSLYGADIRRNHYVVETTGHHEDHEPL